MEPRPDETVELLDRWHAGEEAALHLLIEQHLPRVEQHVRRMLGDKLRQKGETRDFVQDAILEFLRYSPRFQVANARQFHQLVIRIVENVLRDKHDWFTAKRRDLNRERPLPSASVISLDAGARSVTRPSVAAQRSEAEARLRLALELLDPEDRKILVMREYDSMPFAEIGKRVGITENSARMRFQRALPKLAQKVKALSEGRVDELLGGN